MKKFHAYIFSLFVLAVIAGCGGGGGDSTPATTPITTLNSIAVTPADSTVLFATTPQFVATGTYSDGTIKDLASSVKWTATGTTVLTLGPTGIATLKAVGTETVTATVGAVSGSTKITVKAVFTAVAPGGFHTLALKSDGSLFAWGRNLLGQLGDGTTIDKSEPTQVGTVKTWTKIAAGEFHSAAFRADGTLWAWGFNQSGQLGDGTAVNRNAPTKIGTATTWVALAVGKSHTVAIKKDGTLWAWGNNTSGQLWHCHQLDIGFCGGRSHCCSACRRHDLGLGRQHAGPIGPDAFDNGAVYTASQCSDANRA